MLDPSKVVLVFDHDLDELTIMFYGKERRHSVHPVAPLSSALIDPMTGETLGIVYSQFLQTFVPRDPKIAVVLMFAEVLSGGEASGPVIEHLGDEPERTEGFRKRLKGAFDALRGVAPHTISEQKIQSLELLPIPG
jgi:hypothetical protein